jgi:DNA recombination protein RmuC
MVQTLIWVTVGLSVVNLALLGLTLIRLASMKKDNLKQTTHDELRSLRDAVTRSDREIRNEIRASQETTANTLVKTVAELGATQARHIKSGTDAIDVLTQSNEKRLKEVRSTVDERLQAMQTNNENKLEQMRKTVDEQLQSTLEKRLGESFNLVWKLCNTVSERCRTSQQGSATSSAS